MKVDLAVVSVCSTIVYIAAAIALAARIFGTDAILYGSPATWSDLIRRPSEPQPSASFPAAMLGLALMFPAYFVLANGLGLSPELPMARQLTVLALITAAVFGGIPIAISIFERVSWSRGPAFQRPALGALIGAGLLGLTLWPWAIEGFLLSKWLGLSVLGEKQIAAAEGMISQFPSVPLWFLLVTMGVIPAIFEELCFRSFLFGALRTKLAGVPTVIASSLLFGLFHELLFGGRLLTSTLVGGVLGWVRLRTGSVLPGMLLHAVYNCLLLTLAYHQDDLAARWGIEEKEHLPAMWLAASAIGIVVACAIIVVSTRRREVDA